MRAAFHRSFQGWRLFHRLTLYMTLIVLILTFSFVYVSMELYDQAVTQQAVRQMASEARLLAVWVENSQARPTPRPKTAGANSAAGLLRQAAGVLRLNAADGSPVTILLTDAHENILYSSQSSLAHGAFPRLQAVTARSGSSLLGSVTWRGQSWIVVETTLRSPAQTLILALPESALSMTGLLQTFAWLGLTVILVGWLLTWLLSRWLISPLRLLERAARQLQQGLWDISVPKGADLEIAVLADSLLRLAHILRSQEQERKIFLTAVAHELRTPITYIMGYSAALRDDMVRDPHQRADYVKHIHDESARLSRLVEDLLLIARAEADQFRLELCIAEPTVVLQRAADKFLPRATEAGLRFVAEWDPALPEVLMDEQRIEQMLFNLLENSLRYADRSGTVTLSATARKGNLRIEVADQGPGMAPSVVAQIAQPFFRSDRSQHPGGVGLGLTVVREIVKAHGGEWQIESQPGVGTRVSVSLPLHVADEQ